MPVLHDADERRIQRVRVQPPESVRRNFLVDLQIQVGRTAQQLAKEGREKLCRERTEGGDALRRTPDGAARLRRSNERVPRNQDPPRPDVNPPPHQRQAHAGRFAVKEPAARVKLARWAITAT